MIFIFLILLMPQLYSMDKSFWPNIIPELVAYYKNIDYLKKILSYGVDPDQSTKYGETLLNLAIRQNNIEAVEVLLEYGADVNKINEFDSLSPLINAFDYYQNSRKEIILLLLQRRPNVNLYTRQKYNPLVFVNNTTYYINKLLLHGADPYLKDQYDDTAISHLKSLNHLEKAHYIQQASKKLFLMLTKLLHRGTVERGIRLPLDMAKLIASYCYPQEENFIGK